MKLSRRTLELDDIRTDGGTQVRESLDDGWVRELMSLYDDGHTIEPVQIVLDPDGVAWLVDGFHRLEALRRLGWTGLEAAVREGSLEMARFVAAAANKNGMPRGDGDKRRAVLLALSTPEGNRMGVRELARHCGVSKSWAQEILTGGAPATVSGPDSGGTASDMNPPRPRIAKHAELYERIDAALRADHARPDLHIANDLRCGAESVSKRRLVLGLPKPDLGRDRYPARDKAAALLAKHPEWSNRRIADECGTAPETVAKLRSRQGLPPSAARGLRNGGVTPAMAEQPPSAPARPGGDARDLAQVIPLRPRIAANQLEVEALRLVERMNIDSRASFVASVHARWPEAFTGAERRDGSEAR